MLIEPFILDFYFLAQVFFSEQLLAGIYLDISGWYNHSFCLCMFALLELWSFTQNSYFCNFFSRIQGYLLCSQFDFF